MVLEDSQERLDQFQQEFQNRVEYALTNEERLSQAPWWGLYSKETIKYRSGIINGEQIRKITRRLEGINQHELENIIRRVQVIPKEDYDRMERIDDLLETYATQFDFINPLIDLPSIIIPLIKWQSHLVSCSRSRRPLTTIASAIMTLV